MGVMSMAVELAPHDEWQEIEVLSYAARIKTYLDENGVKVLCCPVCGGKPEIRQEKNGCYSVYCECDDCEMRVVGYRRRNNSIRTWNKTGRGVSCGLCV